MENWNNKCCRGGMLRLKKENGWFLVTHRAHAVLAGEFATALERSSCVRPQPLVSVLDAVYHHDDSWIARDEDPFLTPEGLPSAFSRELVGTYDAFEEIDLEDYLAVRGQATEDAAKRDLYAAILISMHTDNLLTEQADLSTLSNEDRVIHAKFIAGQTARRMEIAELLAGDGLDLELLTESGLRRGFEFLQACDSFSLYVCTDFPEPIALRHGFVDVDGEKRQMMFEALGDLKYTLDPWPFESAGLELALIGKSVEGDRFESAEAFRAAYVAAEFETLVVKLISR